MTLLWLVIYQMRDMPHLNPWDWWCLTLMVAVGVDYLG